MSVPGSDLPTSILFCRLCQSLFRQPRILPCLHSFCTDCLGHLAPSPSPQGGPPTLLCPLCGQRDPLPPGGGVSELTPNDFLARMCREYVREVQKTLVSGRSMSPAAGGGHAAATRQGQMSPPLSVIAGRAPAGHFHYPSSSSPSQFLSTSPPPAAAGGYPGGVHLTRALSPPHSPPSAESSFRGWQSSRGVMMSHGYYKGASPSSSPGYLSPSGLPSSPRHSSSPSEAVLQTSRRLSSEMLPSRGVGVERRLSTTPQAVVRTWECLQHKLNSLQSASLQVTYSLETVNMAEANWHQRKQDLRRDVQRRSAQLQFFIKRQERLLLAALDAKKTDDSFNSAAEQARGDLRANLKSLMRETDVVRSVLDLATDSEIMSLSKLLLSSKVSQAPVNMETPELRFVVPEELALEDMVGRDFGCLTSTPISHSIFSPEDIVHQLPEEPEEDDDAFSADTSNRVSSAASPTSSDRFDNSFEHVAFIDAEEEEEEEEGEEVVVEETMEFIDGKMRVVSKRSYPSSKKQQYSSARGQTQRDSDRGSKDQTSRGRATDTRRTVNSSASSVSTWKEMSESAKRQMSQKTGDKQTSNDKETDSQGDDSSQQNKMEKFQNLRESLKQQRRELLLNTPLFPPEGPPGMAHLLRGEKRVQSLDRRASMREDLTRSLSPSAPKRPPEPSIAAPVIHTPTDCKSLVGESKASSVSSDPGTVLTASLMSTSLVSPGSSTSSSTDTTSRPVRRAISAASDRASKMEYLRETWRKRKELLIQNEAYFPAAAENKPASEHKSTTDHGAEEVRAAEPEGKPVASPPKSSIKLSIRSRISHLKQALKKNGKTDDGSQQARSGEAENSTSENSTSVGTTSDKHAASTAVQAAAEKKVLKTLETILQRNAPHSDDAASTPAQPDPTSPGSKPSMLVKPCPRDPSLVVPAPASPTAVPLETLQEDEAKGAQSRQHKVAVGGGGLRPTSPSRGDPSKEAMQHLRANIRQKKERWRSLSLN
ncbi:hypothetical protein ACOMHN_021959 [Nucella lapillus]